MKTIVIAIMDFEYFKEGDFHEIATIKRNTDNLLLTDKMEEVRKMAKEKKNLQKAIDETEYLTGEEINKLKEE